LAIILKDALNSFFKEKEIVEKIDENTIYALWEEIVGMSISKVTKIEKIKNNIIYIKIKNTVWRQELSFQKEALTIKIKEKLPKMKIKEIKFI
jgi:predicted nucleic acid-binding Zn ribbon protein